jgi:ubiquinone/menaquinone biosynthesis C-methylase UbiE
MPLIEFVCPLCQGLLQRESDAFICVRDQRSYPVTFGIPDFRIHADHRTELPAEHALMARLLAEYPRRSFAELIELDPSLMPGLPAGLKARRRTHIESGAVRAKSSLDKIQHLAPLPSRDRYLEIGCGTGGFLVAAAHVFRTAVGLDVSLPRLVLAKKQLEEAGREAVLIGACAEYLPFPERSFQLVVGSDVIEHVKDPIEVLRQAHRVLVPGGATFLATPNRWSLTPEPHVNVWGVGFLPRTWRDSYVKLVQNVPYRDIDLLNWLELRRLLRQTQFSRWQILLPALPSEHTARLPAWARAAVPLYHALKDFSATKWLVYLFGPLFHVICIREET